MKIITRDAVTAGSINGQQVTNFLTFNTSQVLRGSYEFQVRERGWGWEVHCSKDEILIRGEGVI